MPRTTRASTRLADQIGHQPALRLIRAHGGRRLYIPQAMKDDHPIALLVGHAIAVSLSEQYGGDYLEVPDEQTALLDLRNRRICIRFEAGQSIRSLARRYGLSPAMIRKILDATGARTA